MFNQTELVTDHGINKTMDTRIVGLTADDVKVNLYHKNGRVGIDVFKRDKTKEYFNWIVVYSEWVD